MEEEPDQSEQIEGIGSTSIEDTVNVDYIRIDGKFDCNEEVIYSYDDESGEFTVLHRRRCCAVGIWDMEKSHWKAPQTNFCFGAGITLYEVEAYEREKRQSQIMWLALI